MGSMLVDAGIQFGDQLTNAGHGNSGGFFEDSVICRIHEQSLEANGINSQGFTNCSEMTFPPACPKTSRGRLSKSSEIKYSLGVEAATSDSFS